MQAMSSGLGAGMEGGKKADDKTEDQQDKYLKRAIDAKREGNQAEYQKNYLQYQIQRTKDELESKQKIAESKATGKDSVLNSPEQLYFKAIGATNQDPAIRESAANLRMLGTQGGVDSDAYKKAREEHSKLISSKQEGYLKREGLDNEKVKGFADKPGFSEKNPVKDFGKTPTAAKAMFDALPEGAYYINPANNGVNPKTGQPWLLIKRTQGGQPGAAQAQPQRQSGLTPPLAPPAAPYDPSDFSSASEVG
jgi:hypothetical protein